jgi:hypothetical protein
MQDYYLAKRLFFAQKIIIIKEKKRSKNCAFSMLCSVLVGGIVTLSA